MWIADRWQEYKVLDASDGEKLEDWGGYTLVRPDPQVIWSTGRRHGGWRVPDAIYHRSARGGGEWEVRSLPETWDIHYELRTESVNADAAVIAAHTKVTSAPEVIAPGATMTFHLKPFKFKHTGVFPEQAVNWDLSFNLIRGRIEGASHAQGAASRTTDHAPRVLNLFAYTGGATLAAALAGASVTHVDASRGMLTLAHDNASASGLSTAPIRWLVDDCTKFIERELRRGHSYDAIIMDPPSYGRGPKGEVWKMEDDIFNFVSLAARLLSDDPLFLFINSYTTGLQPGVLQTILSLALSEHGIRASYTANTSGAATAPANASGAATAPTNALATISASELGLPIFGTDLILPQGATARFIAP